MSVFLSTATRDRNFKARARNSKHTARKLRRERERNLQALRRMTSR